MCVGVFVCARVCLCVCWLALQLYDATAVTLTRTLCTTRWGDINLAEGAGGVLLCHSSFSGTTVQCVCVCVHVCVCV